jgi:hypothetical protein
MPKYIAAALLAAVLSACSAHSPFILQNTTDSASAADAKAYPAHTNKVRVTSGGLPPDVSYEVLENIEVGRIWYGRGETAQKQLAERARKIGADAVISVKTWYQPSGFSWAAPHCSGTAVKLKEPGSFDLGTLPGEWF